MSPDPAEPLDPPPAAGGGLLHRRALLSGGLLSGGLALAMATAAPPAAAADAGPALDGAPPPFSPYGQPSPHEHNTLRRRGLNYPGIDSNGAAWTPLEKLEGMVTPNGLHFVRSHGGTPAIHPDRHRLVLHGRVRQPLQWDAAALLRYPMQSQLLFLECAGNSSAGWFEEPVQRPVGLVHGLLSCAEWTGVPLRLLLDEAGADPQAGWLVATGADAGALHISLPIDKAAIPAADDCLVALYQNGERLRPENGHPMRLIVPGCKGVLSVKWLRSLRVADQPAMARNETARYTELLPSGLATQFSRVMDVKSVITTPSHGQSLAGPDTYAINGLAWSGHGRIRRVEVSADGGASWADAALPSPVLPRCLTRFRAAWRWSGAPALLQSRATDDTGRVQPTRDLLVAQRGRKGFYHYNAIVTWDVDANGFVSHSYG